MASNSVAGGVVGHWLGQRFGRPLLLRLHGGGGRIDRVEAMFQRWGFWAVVIAGLTPIPYKVFTIGAGAFGIPRLQFVLASIVGRGLRFGTYGVLIFFWGDRFEEFFTGSFDLVISALAAAMFLSLLVWLAWRWQRSRSATAHSEPPR